MVFYCPNCQKEFEVEPRETVTTLQNRVAYKATCPVCGQDMAEFKPGERTPGPAAHTVEGTPASPTLSVSKTPADILAENKEAHRQPGTTLPTAAEPTPDQVLAQAGVGEVQPSTLGQELPVVDMTPTQIADADFREAQAALNAASSDLASGPHAGSAGVGTEEK